MLKLPSSLTTSRGFGQSDVRNPCERNGDGSLHSVLVLLLVVAHLGVQEILDWAHHPLNGLEMWSDLHFSAVLGLPGLAHLLDGVPHGGAHHQGAGPLPQRRGAAAQPCWDLRKWDWIINTKSKLRMSLTWIEIFVRRDPPSSSIFVINLETEFCKSRPESFFSVWFWLN